MEMDSGEREQEILTSVDYGRNWGADNIPGAVLSLFCQQHVLGWVSRFVSPLEANSMIQRCISLHRNQSPVFIVYRERGPFCLLL